MKLENGKPLKNSAKPRKHNSYAADRAFRATAAAAGVLILCILASTAVFLLVNASPVFFSDKAKVEKTIMSFSGGQTSNFFSYVGPLVFGTVIASALALCIAYFVAAGIALFVSHYAPKPLALVLNGVIDLLASIPSVIYGLWGGLVLVPHIHPGRNSAVFGTCIGSGANNFLGCRRACGYDSSDYHFDCQRYFRADSQTSGRSSFGFGRDKMGIDKAGRFAVRTLRTCFGFNAGLRKSIGRNYGGTYDSVSGSRILV